MLKSAVGGAVWSAATVVGGTVVVGAGAALPTWSRIVVPGATSSVDGMLCEMTMPSCTEPIATGTVTTSATQTSLGQLVACRGLGQTFDRWDPDLGRSGRDDEGDRRALGDRGVDRRIGAQHGAGRDVGVRLWVWVTLNAYGSAARTLVAASAVCPVTSGTLT